jgi:hypothetical protein
MIMFVNSHAMHRSEELMVFTIPLRIVRGLRAPLSFLGTQQLAEF